MPFCHQTQSIVWKKKLVGCISIIMVSQPLSCHLTVYCLLPTVSVLRSYSLSVSTEIKGITSETHTKHLWCALICNFNHFCQTLVCLSVTKRNLSCGNKSWWVAFSIIMVSQPLSCHLSPPSRIFSTENGHQGIPCLVEDLKIQFPAQRKKEQLIIMAVGICFATEQRKNAYYSL